MNENSKLSPFLTELRKRLKHAEIDKLADKSMTGMPDFHVTYVGRTTFIEVKLYRPPKKGDGEIVPFEEIARESPTQFEKMKRLAKQGHAWYLFFVAKDQRHYLWHPLDRTVICKPSKQAMIDYLTQSIFVESYPEPGL